MNLSCLYPTPQIHSKSKSGRCPSDFLDISTLLGHFNTEPKPQFAQRRAFSLLVCTLSTHFWLAHKEKHQTCHNVPSNAGYPKAAAWSKLNATIGGRLVNVVPTAKYCASLPGGACTGAQWTSALFRGTIPGSMIDVCCSITHTPSPGSLGRGCAEQLGAGGFSSLIMSRQILTNL
jgi:hypothetical protein